MAKVSHTELMKQNPIIVSQEFNGHVLPARLVTKNTFLLSLTPKITSNSHLSGKFSEKKQKTKNKTKTRRSSTFVIPASWNGNYHSINAKFSSQFCCLLVSSQFFDLPTDDCHFELKTRFFAEMENVFPFDVESFQIFQTKNLV